MVGTRDREGVPGEKERGVEGMRMMGEGKAWAKGKPRRQGASAEKMTLALADLVFFVCSPPDFLHTSNTPLACSPPFHS